MMNWNIKINMPTPATLTMLRLPCYCRTVRQHHILIQQEYGMTSTKLSRTVLVKTCFLLYLTNYPRNKTLNLLNITCIRTLYRKVIQYNYLFMVKKMLTVNIIIYMPMPLLLTVNLSMVNGLNTNPKLYITRKILYNMMKMVKSLILIPP